MDVVFSLTRVAFSLGGRSFREEFGVGVSSVILEVVNKNGNDRFRGYSFVLLWIFT